MSDETPYWEVGRIESFQGGINPKPVKLEIDLIQFVNAHSETFSDEERKSIERGIIRAFAMLGCPFVGRGDYPTYQPGLSIIAQLILQTISDKITKGRDFNTSHEVKDALVNFDVCVEFIDKFLKDLCLTESAYTHSGNGGFLGSNKWKCDKIREAVTPNTHRYPNIFARVQAKINRYQAHILKLWADILIKETKILTTDIDKMKAVVSAKDGYEQKLRDLLEKCMTRGNWNTLDESMILEWLTLFHVTDINELVKIYPNIGSLDRIVLFVISQFTLENNVYKYSYIPKSTSHKSALNFLELTCNVIQKNPQPPQSPQPPQPPVHAYLSSVLLDEYVKSKGHFPKTATEFLKFKSEKMAEPPTPTPTPPTPTPPTPTPTPSTPTPTFVPLDNKFWEPGSPVSPVSPIVGSPHSDETGFGTAQGGKRKYKKMKNGKTIRKKIRKGRRTHYSRRR